MELIIRNYEGSCDVICRFVKIMDDGKKIKITMKSRDAEIEYELKSSDSYAIVNFLTMLEEIRNKGESNG